MVELTTRVGSLELPTPIIAASGTYAYGAEYDGLVAWDRIGAVSVKGLSARPSSGHPAPRMVETAAGMLNAIGLQNIGVECFVAEKLPRLRSTGVVVVANCWGNTVEEYETVVELLDASDGVAALELNLSSPNKREWGRPPASDPAAIAEIVGRSRKRTTKPLWVKLTPNVTDITVTARAAEEAGADAISLINTLKAMAIDIETRRPVLANVTGGLSGPAIKPVALFMVYEACRTVNIPVVGCGGVVSGHDAAEFLMVGACAVQVGTANLYDPRAPERIARELEALIPSLGMNSASELVGSLRLDD